MLRTRAAVSAAAVCLLALGAAGCAGSGDRAEPAPAASLTPDGPATGAELAQWADEAVPENQLGGAAYSARAAMTLLPGEATVLDLGDLDGTGTLALACANPGGEALTVRADDADGRTEQEIACSRSDEPHAAGTTTLTLGDGGTVTVTAASTTMFVYSVTPADEPRR